MGSSQSTPEQPEVGGENHMNVQNQALFPERLRNPEVTILSEILKEKAKLDEKLIKENNAILHTFLSTFIEEMKRKDEIFKLLYNKIFYTGSYYSNLRVSKPDEFDLNLVLKFPKRFVSKETYHPQAPSFMTFHLISEKELDDYPGMKKFFSKGYLIPNEIRKWMQSLIDKVLQTYRCPSTYVRDIKRGAGGPARTIYIIKTDNDQIDIDLVPVIEVEHSDSPPGIDGRVKTKVNISKCFLVPKPYDTCGQAPINDTVIACLWRSHYPEAEGQFIHNFQCVNSVIKLLKLLRDECNWKILASYYLKTIVMWMLLENYNTEYWKQDKLGVRFLEALGRLKDCVGKKEIKYFFSSKCNLLRKLQKAEADNIYNRLTVIIKEINKSPKNLWTTFDCKPTFSYDNY